MGALLALFKRRIVGGVMRYSIRRSKDGKKKDGTWYLDTDQTEARVYISCPFCGKFHDLSKHGVEKNGIVFPCVVCREDQGGCGRYLHVILEKWDLGYRQEKSAWW